MRMVRNVDTHIGMVAQLRSECGRVRVAVRGSVGVSRVMAHVMAGVARMRGRVAGEHE